MRFDQLKGLDPKRVIVLDTETTGFDAKGNDEILSLTIIDLEGTVLFDELVKPEHRQRWPKAQKVNGITPAMVKDKPTLADHRDELMRIWENADLIVGYNIGFDTGFLYASSLGLPRNTEEFDVMREFASSQGLVSWVKLVECAKHYGVGDFDAHSSLGDTEATRKCFLALLDDPEYEKYAKGRRSASTRQTGSRQGTQAKSKLDKIVTWLIVLGVLGVIVCIPQGKLGSALFYALLLAGSIAYKVNRRKGSGS